MKKYVWIDSLKGIAICGVIMVHSGVDVLPFPIGRIGCGGAYGVYIFFVLSAFLAYFSLENTFADKALSLKDIMHWWYRRFIRLAPIFYFTILLVILVNGSESVGIGNVIVHLLFIFGLFPQYINSILSVEWYLGIIAIFYILVPLLYKNVNSLRKASCFFVFSFIICEFVNDFVLQIVPKSYVYESFFGSFWLFEQLPSLSLGIVLYYMLKLVKVNKIKIYPLILVICVSGVIVLARPFGILHHSLLLNYTLCSVIAVCLAVILNAHRCVVLDNGMWRVLGKYSYPIYLLHCLILQQYDKHIGVNTGNVFVDWGTKYIITVMMTLAIAILITQYFDKPIQGILLHIKNKY